MPDCHGRPERLLNDDESGRRVRPGLRRGVQESFRSSGEDLAVSYNLKRLVPPIAIALLAASGCGGVRAPARSSRPTGPQGGSSTAAGDATAALRLARVTRLPAAVQLPAVAPVARGAVALGGLSATDTSVPRTLFIGTEGAHEGKPLPVAVHDAAAANVNGHVYLSAVGARPLRALRSCALRPTPVALSASYPSAPQTSRPPRSGTPPTSLGATPRRSRFARSLRSPQVAARVSPG